MNLIFVILMSLICTSSFGLSPEFSDTMKNMLCEKFDKEKITIEKNRLVLSRMEKDLDQKAKNGMLEQEMCIRRGISALKTIDYAYNSILSKFDSVDCNDFRIKLFNELKRIRDVNTLFSNVNMNIEECLLKQTVLAKNNLENEMIKDEVVGRKELIKTGAEIPQDYPAARSPFR